MSWTWANQLRFSARREQVLDQQILARYIAARTALSIPHLWRLYARAFGSQRRRRPGARGNNEVSEPQWAGRGQKARPASSFLPRHDSRFLPGRASRDMIDARTALSIPFLWRLYARAFGYQRRYRPGWRGRQLTRSKQNTMSWARLTSPPSFVFSPPASNSRFLPDRASRDI